MRYKKPTPLRHLKEINGKMVATHSLENYAKVKLSAEKFDSIEPIKCPCGVFVSKYRIAQGARRCSSCERKCING